MTAPAAAKATDPTEERRRIEQHRDRWQAKLSLRAVYHDYQERIKAGRVLEIGRGSGNLREALRDAVSPDIQWAPWLGVVADAHQRPFGSGVFGNLVMLDVFHHLANPLRFLGEAMQVLRPGGRLIMIEPNVSRVSWVFFKLLHEEPVRLGDDPFDPAQRSGPSPYESHQAIPYLVFLRGAARLRSLVPALRLLSVDRFSLWAYPLSGGFRPWSLLPQALTRSLLRIETRLSPFLGGFA